MFQIICNIDSNNALQTEELLNSYKPLSLSISDKEITAIFNDKLDITRPCDTVWKELSTDDWQVTESINIEGLSLDCPNTVFGNANHPTTQLCIQMLKTLPPSVKTCPLLS